MKNDKIDFVENEGINIDGLDETTDDATDEQESIEDETVDDISEALENEEDSSDAVISLITTKAFVTDCMKLNVRKFPSKDSEVVNVVNVNDELEVYLDLDNDDWFHVRTPSGVIGYCMKQYLNVVTVEQ